MNPSVNDHSNNHKASKSKLLYHEVMFIALHKLLTFGYVGEIPAKGP